MNDLSIRDSDLLSKCEDVIERGKQTFYEVGSALKTIREGKLYRKDYKTFDDYCRERWGWERTYSHYLITASTIAENVHPGEQITEKQLRPLSSLPADEQREVWEEAVRTAPDGKVTAAHVAHVVAEHKEDKASEEQATPKAPSQFNRTNSNIEWADWTWNPVTGCKHECEYCYARDIANRYYGEQGFKPAFHPDRIDAPSNTNPDATRPGGSRVFVCSMADLFGAWVPDKWIEKVFASVRANPQWIFLFLTKNPERYASLTIPDNAWIGTTVDIQSRVESAESAMSKATAKVKFVSCEPLLEPIHFSNLSIFQWVIIGARSKNTQGPEMQPDWKWAFNLTAQAKKAKCKVYWKPNLTVRPKEYPGD